MTITDTNSSNINFVLYKVISLLAFQATSN
jgi:hypothetical protein